MSVIRISDLTFGYEGAAENIFENVSLDIDTGWKTGFIGRNGRGKTTFLKILDGTLEYSGSIQSGVSFEYFPYPGPDGSGMAFDLISGISGAEDWRIYREISLLGAREDILFRPFDTLSMGERTKCLIAAMFLKENSFLLIDEPTNHLDSRGRDSLADYLGRKKGFILVSHDRAFLDRIIDHVISINRSDIEIIKGNFSAWDAQRRQRDSYELAENERLKKDIERLENAAAQAMKWSDRAESKKSPVPGELSAGRRPYYGKKAQKAAARSKAFAVRSERAAEEKSRLLKNIEKTDPLKLSQPGFHSDILCRVVHFTLEYDPDSPGEYCRDISFELHRGDRLRLSGGNGTGKSSLLRAIAGEDVPHSGEVYLPKGLVISRVCQDAEGLRGSLRDYADSRGIDYSRFLTVLRKLDFSREKFEKPLEALSCGERKKAAIAGSLCENAHLLIWDEPLNFVDVLSRMQLEELILTCCPTMIFAEHDSAFGDNVATVTVDLDKN